jgi:hypothetical protein
MPWRDNPRKKFHETLIMLQEVRGEDETIRMLEAELERLRVVKEYRQNRRDLAIASERQAELERRLDAAADALEFYANGENYEGRAASPIQKDKGLLARNALAAIEPESDEDEGEAE